VIVNLSNSDLKKALALFFLVLDSDLKFDKLEGLALRFYESIADYFSKSRINRAKKKLEKLLSQIEERRTL